ncbi:DNA cytosine methyltransferase [Actinomadura livida]|uniref:Cytosine-specific methyltransferase n=1 Tax=Actinomadura livida TaxID=79909 RepID=A0A7W7MW08_9ACTN|nr:MULTISPECIES: DNA cytosine methyltransferase [Actinomadura]MBB4772354.1 DNA (cytosine-5)-methyltransferase 1 [Actinomadura catellatispora]GGU23555.1 cytosine-specific methyltransferase [Actinomadura livida]
MTAFRESSGGPDPLRVIDLFAGCGGLSQGFRETGLFTPVAAVEQDLFAAATYAANFGEDHVYWGDIAEWLEGELPAADVVIGGPPCQGFSNLGAKREDDERNELWDRYVDTLTRVRPKAFVLENVDRFLKTRQFDALKAELDGGRLQDYEIAPGILRATDFGAAQLRRRAIVIGTHKDLAPIPLPESKVPEAEWLTVKSAFDGLTEEIPQHHTELPSGRTFEVFDREVTGKYMAHELHITRKYTTLSRKRFQRIPYGGNRFNLPDELKAPCWIKHTSGSGDVMGRLLWDRPSVTIRTEFFKPEKGRYLHPEQDRALSHLEAARLQGFPDTFEWCGPKLEIARQIGNAVPIALGRALALHVAQGLGVIPPVPGRGHPPSPKGLW